MVQIMIADHPSVVSDSVPQPDEWQAAYSTLFETDCGVPGEQITRVQHEDLPWAGGADPLDLGRASDDPAA
jgi:hypothetical protein